MVNAFKAGNLVAMVNWGFAWDQLQSQADSTVKGKVGVLPLPAMTGGKSATCIGGWQWAVSAFSKNKATSAKLVRYMSSPESAKVPRHRRFAAASVRTDLHRRRRTEEAAAPPRLTPGGAGSKGRPMSDRYGEVSDAVRTSTNAVLARTVKPADAVNDIEGKLRMR